MPKHKTRSSAGNVMIGGQLVPAAILMDGRFVAGIVGPGQAGDAEETIDATGRWVLPGIFDTHAHGREPGYTQKEDFHTASRAATVGGITAVVDVPNVESPTGTLEKFGEKRELAAAKPIGDTMLRGTVISMTREVLGEAGYGEYVAGVAQ